MNTKTHAQQAMKLKGKARNQYIDALPADAGTKRLLKAIVNHKVKK